MCKISKAIQNSKLNEVIFTYLLNWLAYWENTECTHGNKSSVHLDFIKAIIYWNFLTYSSGSQMMRAIGNLVLVALKNIPIMKVVARIRPWQFLYTWFNSGDLVYWKGRKMLINNKAFLEFNHS